MSLTDEDAVLYLVVPDKREKDGMLQLTRPALKNNRTLIKYILFSGLRQHCEDLCRFGDSYRIIEKIARAVEVLRYAC